MSRFTSFLSAIEGYAARLAASPLAKLLAPYARPLAFLLDWAEPLVLLIVVACSVFWAGLDSPP